MQTTRRQLLTTAAALPALALPAVALAAPGNPIAACDQIGPDACIFDVLGQWEAAQAEVDRLFAIESAIDRQIDADLGKPPSPPKVTRCVQPSGEVGWYTDEIARADWDSYWARRRQHPYHAALEAAGHSVEAARGERDRIAGCLRLMPAATIGGVLVKLQNLLAESVWDDVEPFFRHPIERCVAELEAIVGRAGA